MIELGIAIVIFAVALAGLSVGVIFKKRTPLKGACHSAADRQTRGHADGGMCDTCTCGNVSSEN